MHGEGDGESRCGEAGQDAMGQFNKSGDDAPSQNAQFRRERQCGRSIRLWPGPILIPRFSFDIRRACQFEPARDAHKALSPYC